MMQNQKCLITVAYFKNILYMQKMMYEIISIYVILNLGLDVVRYIVSKLQMLCIILFHVKNLLHWDK